MRVVLVTPEYPPARGAGGIATNTAALARALTERGHHVEVVIPGAAAWAGTPPPGGPAEVPVHVLPHRWLPRPGAERHLDDARTALAVRRLRPDVVHAPEWFATGVGPARWGGAPVVTRLATPTHVVEELNGGASGTGSPLLQRLEREQAQRSAVVYGPTRAIADRVGADWELPDVAVVPNPIDLALVRRAGARTGPVDLPPRFLAFIGRLERRKGIATLGQALPAVLAAHPDLHVVLIGRDTGEEDGGVMRAFHADLGAVGDRVHALGELPREDALAVLARAEAVVVPSRWESFGYVAVEAMALGRPVVVSDAGGLAEIVTHDVDGWRVPPDDPLALADELLARLADPDRLRAIGRAASTRADDFDVAAIGDRLAALLEGAAAGPAAPTTDRSVYRSGYRRYFHPGSARDPFAAIYEEKRKAIVAAATAGPRRRLLDAGGGYGRLAEPLSAQHDVVLCDLSEDMLDEAARRLGDRAALVQADASRLPFPDGAFEALVSVDLLVHLPDLQAGLAELARVVEPGGWLIVDTTNARPWWVLAYPRYVDWRPKRLALTLRAGGVLPEWRSTVRHQTPAQMRAAIATNGLELHAVQGIGPGPLTKWHVWLVRRPELRRP